MNEAKKWRPLEVDGEREIISHREPGEEFLFYRSVAEGMIDAVQENCSRGAFENMEGVGMLSDDPVTNLRYHFVVTAAMLARFCMEGAWPWTRPSASATSTSAGWTAATTWRKSSTSTTRWPWTTCAACGT